MAQKVFIESTVDIKQIDALTFFLTENLPNVRNFAGCQSVQIYLNQETGDMLFDEDWDNANNHQRYIEAITSNGVMEQLASFLLAPPTIKYVDGLKL